MPMPTSELHFDGPTPVARHGLGGLLRDSFSNGRIFATVGWHGGLTDISYWGQQHLGGASFFSGGLESAWHKTFRACLGLGSQRHYLPLSDTSLYPFGYTGRSRIKGIAVNQDLLLLPDALVQRFSTRSNPKRLPLFIEMFHMETSAAVNRRGRTWDDFRFHAELNAAITSCTDENADVYRGDDSCSQMNLGVEVRDAPRAITWIGIGCDAPMRMRHSHNHHKLYFSSAPDHGKDEIAFFLVFATSREDVENRLRKLAADVHVECAALIAGYQQRLCSRPCLVLGNAVLDSAFAQYPELIHFMKVHDRPGAVRASQAGYFVWGWDGMTPLIPTTWANESTYTAHILRFFHQTRHRRIGLPHQFTTAFEPRLKWAFPAQAQFIAGLYQYVATTGDLAVAKEVMPTCQFILERCREHLVHDTGLVAGTALWPDFPEAMEEDGNDISSMNNSMLYQGLRSMEYIAHALGDMGLADDCRTWAARLRTSFIKHFYDQEHGFFISSCSSLDLSPRRHFCPQSVFWMTPFARELVSHAPGRIATFMAQHLRSTKCLLTLPPWDTAWMADGNQLGSSFPTADCAYVNVHKLLGDAEGLKTWLSDVSWFWRFHTAPEAFTPETENEHIFGPDNHGRKQLQAISAWYGLAYNGLAGLDVDHEGLTVTPWGDMPVDIRGLRLHGALVDIRIRGSGKHLKSMRLDGRTLPAGVRKIPWSAFAKNGSRLEILRTSVAPPHPVIVRVDGLRVTAVAATPGRLHAQVTGDMAGDVAIQVPIGAAVRIDGQAVEAAREPATGCITVHYQPDHAIEIVIHCRAHRRS